MTVTNGVVERTTSDILQNKEFWFKYGWLTEDDKRHLSQFYSMWETYIEIYS